jgi:hypothetical protein
MLLLLFKHVNVSYFIFFETGVIKNDIIVLGEGVSYAIVIALVVRNMGRTKDTKLNTSHEK